jgi:hypothetical protein
MKVSISAALACSGMLFVAAPAFSHHPFSSEFDDHAPLTLSGIVTRVDWTDPHVRVQLDAKDPNGQARNWALELASPAMLTGKGWSKDTLKQGQMITVKGYRSKSEPFVATARMVEVAGGKQMSAADDADGGPKQ